MAKSKSNNQSYTLRSNGYLLLESLVAISCILFLSVTASKALIQISQTFQKTHDLNTNIDNGQILLELALAYYPQYQDKKLQVLSLDSSHTQYIYKLSRTQSLPCIVKVGGDE
jgi:hypothetical protein